MKTMFYVMGGMTLCVVLALVCFLIPQLQALPYLTAVLSCMVGLLALGGIARYFLCGHL